MQPVRLVVALLLLLLLLLSCARSADPNLQPAPEAVVVTVSGAATGISADDGVIRWLDIPYAQPPIDELRWRAPQPLASTDAPIPRQSDTVMCPQPASQTSGVTEGEFVGSEDCLYLDIVAPADFREQRYPVMFWIYGGGNKTGRKGTYDFAGLAASQKVVVVTINYRLGPFGWFRHPALVAGADTHDASGNFGTLDIIAALKWVNQHIEAFGGDSDNITIFGESAGGRNVFSLLVSPLTEGLFHRAIAQSPTVPSTSVDNAYNANRANPEVDRGSWEVVHELGFDNDKVTAAALRNAALDEILSAYYGLEYDHQEPQIIADGTVIPKAGLLASLQNPALAKRVPVMVGSTRDEAALWLGLNRYFVSGEPVLFGLLPPKLRVREPEKYAFWLSLRSRAWKVRGVDEPLGRLQQAGYEQLYAYRFDWDEQDDNWFIRFSEVLGAVHGSEIAFIQGAPMYGEIGDYMYPDTPSAREMTDIMWAAWGNFADTGNPGSIDNARWPVYSKASPVTMILDVGAARGPLQAEETLDELFDTLAVTPLLSATEKCILAWELAMFVGEPDYSRYREFEGGACAAVDVRAEKAAIEAELIAEFGSSSLP